MPPTSWGKLAATPSPVRRRTAYFPGENHARTTSRGPDQRPKVLAYGTAAASKKPRKPADVAKRFNARKTAAKPRRGDAPGGHAQDGTS